MSILILDVALNGQIFQMTQLVSERVSRTSSQYPIHVLILGHGHVWEVMEL
jgi:hypothetical protein